MQLESAFSGFHKRRFLIKPYFSMAFEEKHKNLSSFVNAAALFTDRFSGSITVRKYLPLKGQPYPAMPYALSIIEGVYSLFFNHPFLNAYHLTSVAVQQKPMDSISS
jgi:hypothetical protein